MDHKHTNNPNAKLTLRKVREIRVRYQQDKVWRVACGFKYASQGILVKLAQDYRVHRSTIREVVKGRTWPDDMQLVA